MIEKRTAYVKCETDASSHVRMTLELQLVEAGAVIGYAARRWHLQGLEIGSDETMIDNPESAWHGQTQLDFVLDQVNADVSARWSAMPEDARQKARDYCALVWTPDIRRQYASEKSTKEAEVRSQNEAIAAKEEEKRLADKAAFDAAVADAVARLKQ